MNVRNVILSFPVLLLVACASTPELKVPLIDGHSVDQAAIPVVNMPEQDYRKGYQAALDQVQRELSNTGPYSLTMSPEPVYRGPVFLRVYLNRMRIGRTYYPEGWYEVEATPGSPGAAVYRRNNNAR